MERTFCPAVSDRDKHLALLTAHKEIQDGLADIFTKPFSAALERAGNAVADKPDTASRLASLHPRKESPYTIFPPDFPRELFSDKIDKTTVDKAMPEFWQIHEANNSTVGGLHESLALPKRTINQHLIAELLESDGHPRGSETELWDLYTQTDATERGQNYATLSFLAAELSNRTRRKEDFTILEQKMINKYFTYPYPTSFYQYAAPHRLSNIIRFPLTPEMDRNYADGLISATGFIIGYLDIDPQFAADCARVSETHPEFIKQRMFRAQDTPENLPRVGVHSLQESVGLAVLPLFADLGRGHEASISTALPTFVDARLPARVTSHAPLGYIGPVGLQGQGSTEQIVAWDGRNKPTFRQEALQGFDDAVREWRSDYHYKRLVEGTPDARTGLMCPFWNTVVQETAELILYVAENLDPHPIPEYSMTNPYHPEEILIDMARDFGIAA